jgi:hypothetical protein
MPERWERELSKLRVLDADEPVVRERVARGPSSAGAPPRRERVIAGVVAGAVAIAAAALLWQALPGNPGQSGNAAAALPALAMSFHDSEVVKEGPDSSYRRVQTTISYGDVRDESFTSSTPSGAHVDWVAAEDLTRFVPGPTVGSRIEFDADGDAPRVLIGQPGQWPNFDRFTEVEQLPDEPGEYVLVFEATYPEGIARTARVVQVVEPSVLQLVLRETGDDEALSGDAYVDGRGAEGFLSETSFTEGDNGPLEKVPEAPTFSPEAWLDIEPGSPVKLVTSATTATSGTFDSYDTFVPGADLPNDLIAGPATIEGSGRVLLAVEATWEHPAPGSGESATSERALFFFPIEVVPEPVVEEPAPPTPSPAPVAQGAVAIDILRSAEETGDPEAYARLSGQEVWLCPDGWSLVNPDGTTDTRVFDCGQSDTFMAAAGTPVVVSGDFASVEATAWTTASSDRMKYADHVPEIDAGADPVVHYRWDVSWGDGSTASFWLQLTVAEGPEDGEASILRIRCGDAGAEVLTPVVVAQPDGVHVHVENLAGAAALEFAIPESPSSTFGGRIDDDESVWPIEPGDVFVECLEQVSDTYQGPRTAKFEVVDENDLWASSTLQCDEGDPVLGVRAHDETGATFPDDETTIRALLHSVQPADEVRLPGYPEGPGVKDGRMVVVRDDRVVAVLYVEETRANDGSVVEQIRGEACADCGIAQGSIG